MPVMTADKSPTEEGFFISFLYALKNTEAATDTQVKEGQAERKRPPAARGKGYYNVSIMLRVSWAERMCGEDDTVSFLFSGTLSPFLRLRQFLSRLPFGPSRPRRGGDLLCGPEGVGQVQPAGADVGTGAAFMQSVSLRYSPCRQNRPFVRTNTNTGHQVHGANLDAFAASYAGGVFHCLRRLRRMQGGRWWPMTGTDRS